MRRAELSRPIRLAMHHGLLDAQCTFFDYGCGRGDDVKRLNTIGIDAAGWDPHHRPETPLRQSDVVNLGYVVNVIEDIDERATVLRSAWELTGRLLCVSARLEDERDEAHVSRMRDGWITRRGTFQKFFSHEELGAWIDSTLQCQSVAAGLGTYFVFRDADERERYLAARFRRLASRSGLSLGAQFQQHRELLQPLVAFIEMRGRLPDPVELSDAEPIISQFGSLKRAVRIVQAGSDPDHWESIRLERTVDLLVHLALMRFHGRPKWAQLPSDLQRDVRTFMTNYTAACAQADRLLFASGNGDALRLAMRASTVGKRTGNGLYVHVSALNDVPALLRVYEGCARALVGTVEDATIVKLHAGEACVSYLSYPDFATDPHPRLYSSVVCELRNRKVRVFHYEGRENPPILHRKDEFVSKSHPDHGKFARLTAAEEKAGLYGDPTRIGTQVAWQALCADAGFTFRGHRLVRAKPTKDPG